MYVWEQEHLSQGWYNTTQRGWATKRSFLNKFYHKFWKFCWREHRFYLKIIMDLNFFDRIFWAKNILRQMKITIFDIKT